VTNVIPGERPSAEDVFYKEWGKETLKENIATLNDAFKLFITLDTTLLSAYLGFYEKVIVYPSWLKIVPASLVIISLIASIAGIYPAAVKVNLDIPQEVKAYKQRRSEFKGRCLVVASATLVVGFIIFLVARFLT
jgi:hypothetical protein